MENKDKSSGKFANFMNKATDFGKKAAAEIQKGAKEIGEQTQKNIHEQRLKYYNPLFREKFYSEEFSLPNVIQIVDDAVRRGVDVCEGAIGWTEKVKDVEVLFLYDDFVKESKINFVPFIKCDAIYCVDSFDNSRYVNTDNIFDRSLNEKMAELAHIAYSLGAKSCTIEMIESEASIVNRKSHISGDVGNINAAVGEEQYKEKRSSQSGKNILYFEGNTVPVKPKLKWFKHEDNINNLIKMRCSGNNAIKHQQLTLRGSASATMSQKSAMAIDAIRKVKGNFEMQNKSTKEHNSLMVLDIEF